MPDVPPTLPPLVERLLPADEYPRLAAFPPFAQGLPHPDFSRILVAEVGGAGGEIRVIWGILQQLHVEPVWIHPEERGRRPGLIRRLWQLVRQVVQSAGAPAAFVLIHDQDAITHVPLVMKLGFEKLSAEVYMVRMPPAGPEE